MSKRGSLQFLLHCLRPGVKLGLGIGVAGALLLGVGSTQAERELPVMAETDFSQALHQSAWDRALASETVTPHWPWEDPSAIAQTKVSQLGLSAAVLKTTDDTRDLSPAPAKVSAASPVKNADELGDVAIGDSITVTSADGSSQVYRVTGRRVIDPHLAEGEKKPVGDGDLSLVTCAPLDPVVAGTLRLIIEAAKPARSAPEPTPGIEQKL